MDERTIDLKLEYLPCINFCMQHNNVRTITSCEIENNSEETLKSVRLSLDGELIKHTEVLFDEVPRNTKLKISSIDISVEQKELLNLTEAMDTCFEASLSVGDEVVLRQSHSIRLMAYDQWTGLSIKPELIASFVTPNSPYISRVLVKAASFLERLSGSCTMDGYQSGDRNRVRMQVAAIYEALRSEGIVYVSAPVSYEAMGQRIRLADKVLGEKLGNCLDTTLLVASVLEAASIHPVIVFIQGHAFVGAWLIDYCYQQVVGDDSSYLVKSSEDGINDLVLLESTAITSSQSLTFDDAVAMTTSNIRNSETFQLFVDVRRSRAAGVLPLPQLVKEGDSFVIDNEGLKHDNATEQIKIHDHLELNLDYDKKNLSKLDLWERKLLDFSLRNNLLNCRNGSRTIPFVSFNIDTLEDRMFDGEDYRINPYPETKVEMDETKIYDSEVIAPHMRELVSDEIQRNRLISYLTQSELSTALKFLYRASRNSIEENGANTLFLVLGMLKWYENDRSVVPRFAPILLMPVDIIRRSGTDYVIRTREEEMILNTTLVELLKVQFHVDLGMLYPLPTDAKGIDVKLVLTTVRKAISEMKNWNVLNESMLGLFSFSKFVMWNDIHTNATKLKENPVVASLIEGKVKLEHTDDMVDARELDRNHAPSDYAIPIDVDSSQMEAVVESGRGKSFILYGPPGTGKSQTITNMIANALYQGKRVLFVAEKMAALSVVQKRLDKIGLAPFCLELHSNKVTKQHFLLQMKTALEAVRIMEPEDYKKIADKLFNDRKKLIGYTDSLHTRHESGYSLYDCITNYLHLEHQKDENGNAIAEMKPTNPQTFLRTNREQMERWCEKLGDLNTVFNITGHPSDHPLAGLEPVVTDSVSLQRLCNSLNEYCRRFENLRNTSKNVEQHLGKSIIINDEDYGWLNEYLTTLAGTPVLNYDLFTVCTNEEKSQLAMEFLATSRKKNDVEKMVLQQCRPEIFNHDSRALRAEWEEIASKWFVPRFFAKRTFMQRMSPICPSVKFDDMPRLFGLLDSHSQLQQRVNLLMTRGMNILVRESTGNSDLETMERSIENGRRLSALISDYQRRHNLGIADVAQTFYSVPEATWKSLKDFLLRAYTDSYAQLNSSLNDIRSIAIIDLPGDKLLTSIAEKTGQWISSIDMAKDWSQWTMRKQELRQIGMSDAVAMIEKASASPDTTSVALRKGVFHILATHIIANDEKLKMFDGLIFDDTVKKYKEETQKFQELTKKELYCRLAANIPSQTLAAVSNSEMGILKRNIQNGGRGSSIRKIIDQIPTLLPKLCPCMLMSPISVAQYIDLNTEKFDLVIFDEASQMPTSEAVGAIARGKALICVGDPKQMPPTSFFSTQQVDEEESDIDDMESILDDCITLSMPSHYLSWHYRSKHESLIAFSNANYYDSKLFTFPSIDDRLQKVSLVPIDGTYDKGHSRSNKAEAQAIVAEVVRRLKDENLRNLSIGIVSFSKVQQNLIEDILIDELAKDPDLEDKAYNCNEPIFIKNLENVQGDERDVILFSVGYGPDKSGHVSMNFGPLNNAGGERRLNVAVSRARYEMIVFSTLRAEQIDLRRSSAKGVEGLKNFLEFASTGRLSLDGSMFANRQALSQDNELALPQLIAEELKGKGYDVVPLVGRSNFKIDIAVCNPDDKNEYLLGILCDGKNYYETKTARDREIVQTGVLRGLHWNIMRVWSVDWFQNKQRVMKRIVEAIDKAIEEKKNNTQPKPFGENVGSFENKAPAKDKKTDKKVQLENATSADPNAPIATLLQGEKVIEDVNQRESMYVHAQIPNQVVFPPFNDRRSVNIIGKMVQKVITCEQPVNNTYLYKTIARLVEQPRVTSTLQTVIDNLLRPYYLDPLSDAETRTYWTSMEIARDFKIYRKEEGREITDIPMIEILNATEYAMEQLISLPRADLVLQVAHLLGFARRGVKINNAIDNAITILIRRGFIVEKEGNLVHNG